MDFSLTVAYFHFGQKHDSEQYSRVTYRNHRFDEIFPKLKTVFGFSVQKLLQKTDFFSFKKTRFSCIF